MVESLFRLRSEIGATRNGSEQSRWANMPQELLREVLARVEASEATWPRRKSMVACGGVCRAWRHAANDVAMPPALSSKITFPISLKQVEHWLEPLILAPVSLGYAILASVFSHA